MGTLLWTPPAVSRLHLPSSNMEPNLVWLLLVALLASKSWGHEYYSGQCPQFPPMKNFLWEKFAPGTWFVPRKTGTTSSCLTYKFAKDQNGFRTGQCGKRGNFLLETPLASTTSTFTPGSCQPQRNGACLPRWLQSSPSILSVLRVTLCLHLTTYRRGSSAPARSSMSSPCSTSTGSPVHSCSGSPR